MEKSWLPQSFKLPQPANVVPQFMFQPIPYVPSPYRMSATSRDNPIVTSDSLDLIKEFNIPLSTPAMDPSDP